MGNFSVMANSYCYRGNLDMTVLAEKGVFLHGHWMKSEGQVGGTSRRDKLEGQVRGTSWTTYVYCLTLISWASARSQSGIFQPVQSSLCEQAAASAVAQIDPWVNLGSSCKLSKLSLQVVPPTCPSDLSLRLVPPTCPSDFIQCPCENTPFFSRTSDCLGLATSVYDWTL